MAVDGSCLNLPSHDSIEQEFGPFCDQPRQARCSILYDVLNLVPVDGQISRIETGERQLLLEHLDQLQKGDLLLMDRGYPAQWLFLLLANKGIDFCVRLSDYTWQEATDFAFSVNQQAHVTFKVSKRYHTLLQAHQVDIDQSLTVRLVKVKLDTGKTEILCISLLDQEQFPIQVFGPLYHRRWQAEEAFKMLKSRAELECFSGKTAHAVKQDFYAKILAVSPCSMYALPIEQKVRAECQADPNRKHPKKINRTQALRATYEVLIPVFIKKLCQKAMECFDDLVFKTTEIVRLNRKNPRMHKAPKKNIWPTKSYNSA